MKYESLKQFNKLNLKKIKQLIKSGVVFLKPKTCVVENEVEIASGVVIYPNNIILGNTKILSDCTLLEGNTIKSSVINTGSMIEKSVIVNSVVGENCAIGPFAHLRPNSKNSTVGNGSKVPHLSYVGDAEIGENVNIGCGVVFANYNGVKKFKTKVGNNCFIGCNSNLIAPITLENNCYVAAGTTLTKCLKNATFVISRPELRIKPNKLNK